MNILKYIISIMLLNFTVIQHVQSNDIYEAAKNGNLDLIQKYITDGGDINATKTMDGVKDTHDRYHYQYFSDNPRYIHYFNYAWKNLGEGYSYSMAVAPRNRNIDYENDIELSPLVTTIIHNQEDAAKLLINAGANVNVDDNYGRLPIHYACYYGMNNIIELLIDTNIKNNRKTNINYKEDLGESFGDPFFEESGLKRSPLLMSFYGGSMRNMEAIKLLISLGADVHDTDALGRNPLILAAQDNNLELMNILVEKGVNVNVTDENNIFPLAYAVLHNNLEMIKYLVSKGADTTKLYKGSSLLAFAALGPDYLKKLLMPSTKASTNGSVEIMEFLISKNVDPNGGVIPPLHMAILSNNITNVNYLITKGASVSKLVGSGNKRSPMHQAAFKNRIEIAKILAEHGAIIITLDANGYRPFDYAVRYGFDEFLALLKRHGGNVIPPEPETLDDSTWPN